MLKAKSVRRAVETAAASFVVIALIVAGAVVLASTMQGGGRPGTETSQTSNTTASSDGLRLTVSSNASEITVGQGLNVSLSVVNTLPVVNVLKPSNDWLMHGVPVALWPPCYFGLPAEAAVLQGNYSSQDIRSAADVTFDYVCMEDVAVDHVIIQPNSDQVNLTGLYSVTNENQTLGPFHMSLSFTTGGYWNLQNLSRELNIPILGEQYPPRPPAYVPFAPGEYTIAVADEWGQLVILHFSVRSTAGAAHLGVSFVPPWHYVGNVTISGALSACEALRLPCPFNPTSNAEEFTDGTSVIYAEEITGCGPPQGCVTSTILISNNSVYCITPKVPWAELCPSAVGATTSTTASHSTYTSTAIQQNATVAGDVSVGPAYPVCQAGKYCNVNMTGYAIGFTEQGASSADFETLTYDGSFSMELAPGAYTVNLYYCKGTAFPADCAPSCPWMGCSSFYVNNKALESFPFQISAAGGQTIALDVSIKTGIE